jgi:hypothetical protein
MTHGLTRILTLAAATAVMLGLAPAASAHVELEATLDSAQETGTIDTMGHNPTGTASLVYDFETNTIQYEVTASDLTGPALLAHIHPGVRGVSGGPLACCTLAAATGTDPVTISGTTAALSASEVEALFTDGLYVNIHTSANIGGEIRGQITIKEGQCDCTGSRKAFTKCVKQAIKALPKDDKKSEAVKDLKKAVKRSFCGKRKAPKKAIGCCLGVTPVENIVTGNICAAVPETKCTKFGGTSKGEGSDCADPFCSPSGAFIDDSSLF